METSHVGHHLSEYSLGTSHVGHHLSEYSLATGKSQFCLQQQNQSSCGGIIIISTEPEGRGSYISHLPKTEAN